MSSDHALGEFDIIRQYFSSLTDPREDVIAAIGDDCALLSPPAGKAIAVSTDTLVSDRHFFADADPVSIGHKSLAVNLSDLAAMGAKPAWVSLALTLPEVNEVWLQQFSQGFASLARQHGVQLIGGDTTRGPLSITITVHGLLDADKVLRRDTAQVGDIVCVSGVLGEAALALQLLKNHQQVDDTILQALNFPQPRIELGQALAGVATACIDVSDGLLADLGHICEASGCGASLELAKLPASKNVKPLSSDEHHKLQLTGGDDYELCFTIPVSKLEKLVDISQRTNVLITPVGLIKDSGAIQVVDEQGKQITFKQTGFQHFHA